nr:MAG TPA: hypothetical protein [Caudoviricetes sp.]
MQKIVQNCPFFYYSCSFYFLHSPKSKKCGKPCIS